jgi:hypothetical protein
VTARVHPFVQHADDLDHTFLGNAIVENMNWSPDPCAFGAAGISDVEAADPAGTKFGSLPRERPSRLIRDLSHCGCENSGVLLPTLGAPTLGARGKDVGEIDLRRAGEPKPRHAVLPHALRGRRPRQPFEIPFEIDVLDLREVAPIERLDTEPDLGAKRLQSEAVFFAALLEDAQGISDGFAGVLILAGVDDLLNEGVLLGCQADVPGRHPDLSQSRQHTTFGKDCQCLPLS